MTPKQWLISRFGYQAWQNSTPAQRATAIAKVIAAMRQTYWGA